MSTESPTPENKPAEVITVKKTKVYWITGAMVILLAATVFFFIHGSNKATAEPEKKPAPLFHRDEPTEPQIFQGDFKAKVREMLDSGKSVMEISKETKIRIDEVRKIKKEYKKEKAGQ